MRLTIFVMLVLVRGIVFSSEYWISQQSNITSILFRCEFIDSLKGWAVGDSGKIMHTSNGGNLWLQQYSGLSYFIFDLSFLNSNTGWCIASDVNAFPHPVLLRTTNAGLNWIDIYHPDTNNMLFTVHFRDINTGWLGGFAGTILFTTNGGINWTDVQDTSSFGVNTVWRISSFGSSFGFASGGWQDLSGVVWKSNSTGNYWLSQGISPEPIYKVIYQDSLHGFGMGGDPEYGASIIRTSDGGNSWSYNFISLFGIAKSFDYRTPDEIWAALSIGRKWAFSSDAGSSWIEISTNNDAALNDVFFVDPYHGWAVGDSGVILKYNTEVIGIKNNHSSSSESSELFQNYPNPFNQSTVIEFRSNEFSKVHIILYDILGREVKVIFDDFLQPGVHRLTVNSKDLSSGVYFYKLTSRKFNQTRKLVIIK